MARTFVAINDWCHKLLREITRHTRLAGCGPESPLETVGYQVRPEELPEAYFSLTASHSLGGLSLDQARSGRWHVRAGCRSALWEAAGGLDLTRLDRRCWGDLRLKSAPGSAPMVSGELLVFGAGMVRLSTPPGPHGRLYTSLENVSRRIWALQRDPRLGAGLVQKRVFDSTNVIYGDAFGELEQLWDRRADLAFLDQVARSLSRFRDWQQLPFATQPPLNPAAVMNLHFRSQALWKVPPKNGRGLLRRIEFLLEHTILDSSAITILPGQAAGPSHLSPNTARDGWQDVSGYDGWLPGTGGSLN